MIYPRRFEKKISSYHLVKDFSSKI